MKLEKEDYLEPECVLCGKPGEMSAARPIPIGRVIEKLAEYEEKNDREGAGRHLHYWLTEAEACGDLRGQLTLNNELMGYYRMQGDGQNARKHAAQAVELIRLLEMEDTITAGTTWVNAGTVLEAFGDAAGAMDYFEKAQENYRWNLDESDARLGGLCNNMALALTTLGRSEEAEAMFRKALRVMERQPAGELEQAVTWLNLADIAQDCYEPEDAAAEAEACLDRAAELLETGTLPRNAYYAFVCEKCIPVFDHYGYFAEAETLRERVKKIRERA